MNRISTLTGVLAAAIASLALSGCASAPIHYYTLVAPAQTAPAPSADYAFELAPIELPADVDTPQLVIRDGAAREIILDNEHWVAPLADQVQQALSADLSRDLSARDLTGLPHGSAKVLQIKISLRRFESRPGQSALLEAAWLVRPPASEQAKPVVCSSLIEVPVGADYTALILGHQQALAALAQRVAAVVGPLAAGSAPACPAG